MLAAGLLVLALQLNGGNHTAPSADPAGDAVSVERIRRGLEQQDHLQIPPPPSAQTDPPTFRVRIEGTPLETPLDVVRRELAEQASSPRTVSRVPGAVTPLVEVDVLAIARTLVHQIERARYEAAQRRIHAEVSAELEAFCVLNDCTQVNEGLALPSPLR